MSEEKGANALIAFKECLVDLETLRVVHRDDISTNEIIGWDANQDLEQVSLPRASYPVPGTGSEIVVKNWVVEDAIVGYEILRRRASSGEVVWTHAQAPAPMGNAVKMVLEGDKLILAVYHNIASGSDLICVDFHSGRQIWRGEVAQLLVDHSKYCNEVFLRTFKNKVALVGEEVGGHYLQVFDLETGGNLLTLMRKV